jgi:hypothetical protein
MTVQTMRRSAVATLVAVAGASAAGLWLGGEVGAAAPGPVADMAKRKSLRVVDTVRLALVSRNGAILYERGTATGTLPGRVTATFRTSVTKVTGTVTFLPYSGGSITMTTVGYPQSAGTVARFTGNIAVLRGTGKYSRALGSGTFNGTVNRRTWAVTVNARANLTY